MSEIRSQATPARDEAKRETLARLGMIHLAERYGTRLRLEPSCDNEIRVDITYSGGMETHFPNALDLLESIEAIVESMGLRKSRTVNSVEELEALPPRSVIELPDGEIGMIMVARDKRHVVGYPQCIPTSELSDVIRSTYGDPIRVLFTPGDAG